jgi:thiol-disulfide isomerase/thioredoxin
MIHALILALTLAVSSDPAPLPVKGYADARQESLDTGKPLLVMVSTGWCPACQIMKRRIMPKVRQDGALDGLVYTTVNPDNEEELSRILIGNGPIPELILFRHVGKKDENLWTREVLVGSQSVEAVEGLIGFKKVAK